MIMLPHFHSTNPTFDNTKINTYNIIQLMTFNVKNYSSVIDNYNNNFTKRISNLITQIRNNNIQI